MPELPEVETIKNDLQKVIAGSRITGVRVHNPVVIREPSPEVFEKTIKGLTVKNVLRRGKLLILELSGGSALTIHLKMTGQLVYPGGAKNSRLSFCLSGGRVLDFNDQRLFGELRLVKDWTKIKFVQGLGPEPFDLSYDDFKGMFSRKKTRIKPLLMDQAFISGIGNLYAAEILFRAGIDPRRPAQTLDEEERQGLFKSIKGVLRSAIEHGGSSIDDYVRLSGKRGDYARFHRVYGRENKPCFVCGTAIKRIPQGGRSTYFCPRCQK
jgi:formamidopyrimidine-DNA glycosylase